MKKIYLLISVLFSISVSLFAQDSGQKKLGRIGISYSSFGIIQDVRNPSPARYDAGPSSGLPFYIDKNFYTIGIDYVRALNTWLEYEFGIEYSRKVGSEKTSYPYGDYIVNKANSTFVSFPFTMRANFLRFFFMNGGILMDLDLGGYKPQRYQSGIGYLFGIAAKYDFKFGASVFVNPYFKKRSLISIWPTRIG